MIKNIKEQLNKIKDDELYTTREINEMGVIAGKNKYSNFNLYRFIKSGKLKALNLSSGKQPQYSVKGIDLRNFLKEMYDL